MPQETQTNSAIDNPTGRLAARLASLSDFRPEPPRDFYADAETNTLRWTAPNDSEITHYRLRIDHDDGEPDVEMPDGTHLYQLSFGDIFVLTAYNRANGLESSPVIVTYAARSGTGSGDCDCGAGFTHVEEHEMTADYTVPATTFTPCTGDMLTWFLSQDATGYHAVTWNSQYRNAPTTDIAGTPSTLSVVKFAARNSKWYYTGLETGLTTL